MYLFYSLIVVATLPLLALVLLPGCRKRLESLTNDTPFADLSLVSPLQRVLFASPCRSPSKPMTSFWSSLVITTVGLFVLLNVQSVRLPLWFPILVIVCGTLSAFHHLRSYGQFHDDWLRVLDIVLALGLAGIMLGNGLLGSSPLPLAAGVFAILLLGSQTTNSSRRTCHAALHVAAAATILLFAFSDNSLRHRSSYVL